MNPKMFDQPLSLFPILFYLFFFFPIYYFNWYTRIKNLALFCLFDPIYIFLLYTLRCCLRCLKSIHFEHFFFAFGKHIWLNYFPVNIYLFTVTNRNTRKRCEICSKITTNTWEQRHCHRSVVFIFHIGYFEQCQLGYLYIFDAALDISLTWQPLINLSVSSVHKKVTHT